MRWIGASTYESGRFWVRKFAEENPINLKSYIDGIRQQYKNEIDPQERAMIVKVGKLAQAAHIKAFGKEYPR